MKGASGTFCFLDGLYEPSLKICTFTKMFYKNLEEKK